MGIFGNSSSSVLEAEIGNLIKLTAGCGCES